FDDAVAGCSLQRGQRGAQQQSVPACDRVHVPIVSAQCEGGMRGGAGYNARCTGRSVNMAGSGLDGWSGRVDQPEDASTRRWHQWVRTPEAGAASGVALLGFACDEGVRRNHGRVGAAEGPAALRRMLSNLPTLDEVPLYDAGT